MNAHKLGNYLIGQDCCHACNNCRKKPIYIYKWIEMSSVSIDFVCKKGVDFITDTHSVVRGKELVELNDKIILALFLMFKKFNWDEEDSGKREREVWNFVKNWRK